MITSERFIRTFSMKFALQYVCGTLISNIHSSAERRCHDQGIANDHIPLKTSLNRIDSHAQDDHSLFRQRMHNPNLAKSKTVRHRVILQSHWYVKLTMISLDERVHGDYRVSWLDASRMRVAQALERAQESS